MTGRAARTIDREKLTESVTSLLRYCRKSDWAGFDPYDALNSRLFARTPLHRSRICRIALTQLLKRLPIDLRPMLSLPPTHNPKALALFLDAATRLGRTGMVQGDDLWRPMVAKLAALRSPGISYWCWGYSFPWQTRTMQVPRGAPNLVCTVFVAGALLDAYEESGDESCLGMAKSAAEYIADELYWTEGDSAGLSYPLPFLRGEVHNANFLGAALLSRVYRLCGTERFVEPALKVARRSASRQNEDGSWFYGESPQQRWIDNFHTGYNLCALRTICRCLQTAEFRPHIGRGFDFYRKHFFTAEGAPRYFHDRTYPVDIHSVAQSIITLLTLKEPGDGSDELVDAVYRWAMEQMWDERGYFYYQVLPLYKNRISYMRWSQAWMLLALSQLLESCCDEGNKGDTRGSR